ncbi:hypothetical protein GCM10009425_27960 [Pseudomonas asuensis]|uniref:Uncharacterized protein n=1 Tax=Pseudomonas asuensis TaxID=1825787 RepID=A0ABQ2GVM8_9PSED|nr:hypothetical protein GCM10009425_27960 [Pseudomonas asuensis]
MPAQTDSDKSRSKAQGYDKEMTARRFMQFYPLEKRESMTEYALPLHLLLGNYAITRNIGRTAW